MLELAQSTTWAGVSIGSWFLLVVSVSAVATRLGTKWIVESMLHADDAIVVMALITNIGSTLAIYIQSLNGRASTSAELPQLQLAAFTKAAYTMSLLFIPTLCLARLSGLALLRKITPAIEHQRIGSALTILTVLVAVAFEMAAAFQCPLPRTWDTSQPGCIDKVSFWQSFGAFQIVADLGMILLALYIIVPLNMRLSAKLLIFASFSVRLLDIAAVCVLITFAITFRSADVVASTWQWALLAQISQTVGIVTVCVPYFRPLMAALPSGVFQSKKSSQPSRGDSSVLRSFRRMVARRRVFITGYTDRHEGLNDSQVLQSESLNELYGGGGSVEAHVPTARDRIERLGD